MRITLAIFLFSFAAMGQEYNFNGAWEFVGPADKPDSPNYNSACGIGPVEFIRVYSKNSNHLLAGSNSGGLFFSEDGGENWINSGSDRWVYSGCGWADFYPENEKTWFAYSQVSDNNGKPGKMSVQGGIMRTFDAGTTWECIASGSANFGTNSATVYGFRFHPKNPKLLFVLSDEGLFFTTDCLAEKVTWQKLTSFGGLIYDMDFVGEEAYVSVMQHGSWNVIQYNHSKGTHTVLKPVSELKDDKRGITFEPIGENLLVLIDHTKLNDELWEYKPADSTFKKLLANQQVNFGSGHTFKVNPHTNNEFMLGISTNIKRWNYTTLKEKKVGGGYHVDCEFVMYDPVDTSKIYLACHGGVYISYDQGLTWQSKSKGLGIAEVMGMDVSESDAGQVVIGTFHDGSSVLADFEKNGNYSWRTVNGGDALTPLIDPTDGAIVYTSTQFTGGGIYYSNDTGQTPSNIHSANGMSTSGWELTAVLHPVEEKMLFFNFTRKDGASKNSIDIARTSDASKKKNAEIISDFGAQFSMGSYKVYGLYNSAFQPDFLYAYVLHYDKTDDGKAITRHRLFRTEMARDSASKVSASWYELMHPLNSWIGDIQTDPLNPDLVYLCYSGTGEDAENGLIYALKYNKKTKSLKKALNISRNIPNSVAGRFNMVCRQNGGTEMFVATRTGVYYGNKKTIRGKADWQMVGYGLPHCKVFGLHFHEKEKILTVGLFGRGVWRYRF